MRFWPKSRKARQRLTILLAVAPVLALAAGLTLFGLRDSISFFYTPAQAAEAHVPPGRAVQLGGLVEMGSVRKFPDGGVSFRVTDRKASAPVLYRGDLPDLFREGQGVVAEGSFNSQGQFIAKRVLAKHDERYMPRDVAKALKAQGEWRGDGAAPPAYSAPSSK
ncbi:cytochrome c-type biogenesis protein CcmE [Caulobacter ginsengisoli]|uniref:Cytochrome c-type biogenesis protein CcmE n=1 Tax=Caulobacter ginsengisoli TaxID=400775 RepID=A0ABU0IND3_9CAUL|nr:cytochrome c maturation protein CcmE [Caulobacter ginsengisoli]MDQ0463523.1 cytochrome c-type biogenesis protein CcmE [Caulobacter ginsengisoli]